ncbi:MAG: OmpH family outer membrane protein [Deltaproteobacteria bacterium]|nr:OmpH family outer membrane protein [Deltaproteobacteria bacterium]
MIRSLVVGGTLLLALHAGTAEAKDLRIGVVNMQRAVSETEEGRKAEAKLQDLKDKLEAELNRKLKEFYEEENKLRKAWSILKEEERRKRADDSRRKFEGLQKRYMEAERELMKKKTDAFMAITNRLTKIIQKIAERDKFDFIFANAAVLWAPRHVDVTNDVIRSYNQAKK